MRIIQFAVPALAATAVSYFLTPWVCRLARHVGALDVPGPRKLHQTPVPRLGGVAVVFALVSIGAAVCLPVPYFGPVVSRALWQPIGLGLIPVLIVSFWDDLSAQPPILKLLGQTLGAALVVWSGLHLTPDVHLFGYAVPLGPLYLPLSILWIVAVTNAFNIIDGLDGLSAGLALISAASLTAVALLSKNPEVAVICLILMGALIGFLPYNTYPARVFLGDGGAAGIGFCLACLALDGGSRLSGGLAVLVPVFAMGVPVADTTVSVLRRTLKSDPSGKWRLFEADDEHIHHRLVRLGLHHRSAVMVLHGAAIVAGVVGIGSLFITASNAALLLGTALVATLIGVGRLGYDEFALFRRGLLLKLYDAPVLKLGFFRVFVDVSLAAAALFLAMPLTHERWTLREDVELLLRYLPFVSPIAVASFWAFGLYTRAWRFAGIEDVVNLIAAVVTASAGSLIVLRLSVDGAASIRLFVSMTLILLMLAGAGRSSFRVFNHWRVRSRRDGRRVGIYGAGFCGMMAIQELQTNVDLKLVPVCFIDDDPDKLGRRFSGLSVLGTRDDIGRLAREHRLETILVATVKILPVNLATAARECHAANLSLMQFSMSVDAIRMNPAGVRLLHVSSGYK